MPKKRYPGIRPFETADKDLFFGRSRDVQDLSILIGVEKLVVLFGKSGYGKSSLINAGLIPLLTAYSNQEPETIRPIVVRFGSYLGEGRSNSPVIATLTAHTIGKTSTLGNNTEIIVKAGDFLDALTKERSLWYHFKRRQIAEKVHFLLIFDQFEEFFTYPSTQQDAFKTELAELLYVKLPQSFRENAVRLPREQRELLSQPLEVKALFAIRSDRISQLDSLKDKLPDILHKRFELKGLSREQAQEAIEKPASLTLIAKTNSSNSDTNIDPDFDCPPFTYSLESLSLILDKLNESKTHNRQKGIEGFQVQILCEYLEGEVVAGRIPGNHIKPKHFSDKINDIYEGYYQRLLNKLLPKTVKAAQSLIEESLIFTDDQTGESRRLSVDADVLIQRYSISGITQETLNELENTFLLRREINSVGSYNYELSHDSLVLPVLSLKNKREATEIGASKRKKMSFVYIFVSLLSLIFIPIGYIYNGTLGSYGDGTISSEITIKHRDLFMRLDIDPVISKTQKYIQNKYSNLRCGEKPSIVFILDEASRTIEADISNIKLEIINDPYSCRLFSFINEECKCYKKEKIKIMISFSPESKGEIRIRLLFNAKYASGLYDNVRNSAYLELGAEYDDYLQIYVSRFVNDYRKFLTNQLPYLNEI